VETSCADFGFAYCSTAGVCTCEPGRTGKDGGCNALVPEVTGDATTEVTNDGSLVCVNGWTTADGSTSGARCDTPSTDATASDDASDSGLLTVGGCADLDGAIHNAQSIEADLAIAYQVDTSNVAFSVARATAASGNCADAADICEVSIKVRSSELVGLSDADKTAIQEAALGLITQYGYTFCSLTLSSCDDGVKGGDEEDADCGGSCNTVCAEPTCDDGLRNGDEDGFDCGGSNCDACEAIGSGAASTQAITMTSLFAVLLSCMGLLWA